jgi:hypothetical protein
MNLNKLRIVRLPDLSGGFGSALKSVALSALEGGGIFEMPLNPEQYARHFKISYGCPPEHGTENAEAQFKQVQQDTLSIKFTIDGTGLVPIQQPAIDAVTQAFALVDTDKQTAFVAAKLAQLKLIAAGISDEKHRPPFVLVSWGKLSFRGYLEDMTQTFSLFHPTGVPLRVEVELKIKEDRPRNSVLAALSLLSPDLTRKRQVKSSDNILTLCEDVYEKPDYYIEVAKANNLTNFRKIEAGRELIFPPVAK